MSLLDKLRKNSKIKESIGLESSSFFGTTEFIKTEVPIINLALSGDLDGGLTSGLTVYAAPSKHFKSSLALFSAKAFLEKNPEGVIIFYDSEFGSPPAYWKQFDIDTKRVLHSPISNIEELKFDIMHQLDNIEKNEKVMILVDSIGNLASKKEVDDALKENSAADMTRAKQLKSLFRMITPILKLKDIPCIVIGHTYEEQGLFPKKILSGGCVVGGTKITLADGTLKNVEDFVVGDMVQTLMGPKQVTHTWNPDTLEVGEPECFEIEFEDGFKVICSDVHKFLDKNDKWVEAKDLKAGDFCKKINLNKKKTMIVKNVRHIGKRKVYDLSVEDAEHYVLENGIITHNTGIMYSADTVLFIGKSQIKKGTELEGFNFDITIEKSRFVKEKSKLGFSVTWENGINKYSGLLNIALEGGYVTKPSNGFYARAHIPDDKKVREAVTNTKEFWDPIINDTDFKEFCKAKFALGGSDKITKNEEEVDLDEE